MSSDAEWRAEEQIPADFERLACNTVALLAAGKRPLAVFYIMPSSAFCPTSGYSWEPGTVALEIENAGGNGGLPCPAAPKSKTGPPGRLIFDWEASGNSSAVPFDGRRPVVDTAFWERLRRRWRTAG